MLDHSPITINTFKGLWLRTGQNTVGDNKDSVPSDHFSNDNNVQFIEAGFRTRNGLQLLSAIPNILKVQNYQTSTSETLLVLDTSGRIWDTAFPATPILTIATMTDFGFQSVSGRAYISPSNGERGLSGEELYVYKGAGVAARKAAGTHPTTVEGALAAANSGTAGNVEPGLHLFAVVYETDTGFLTALGPTTFPSVTAPGNKKVDLSAVPVAVSTAVTKRHIVATRAIVAYNGDQDGYQFFFVPDGVIPNNTATTITVNFFDVELLEDASHLIDVFAEIPAGVGLSTYRNRLVLYSESANPTVVRISEPGEPEAFNQVTGLIQVPIGGNSYSNSGAITNARELRDVLYIWDNIRTFSAVDNGEDPSDWTLSILDQGLGCSVHGVATVLDTGGTSIDYIIVCNFSGIWLFNGTYNTPPLSWKINNLWQGLNFSDFLNIVIVNDSIGKCLYIILPDRAKILIGDYQVALNPQEIKWSYWTFSISTSAIALTQFDRLVITSAAVSGSGVYYIERGKRNDTIYVTYSPVTSTNVAIPNPFVEGYLLGDDSAESILHYGAVTLRVNGSGSLHMTLKGLDGVKTKALNALTMGSSPGKEPTVLTNFNSQRALLRIETDAIDEFMEIHRIVYWIKQVATSYPSGGR